MSSVSGCPSTVCTGWDGLMGVAYIEYYKHIPRNIGYDRFRETRIRLTEASL